MISYQKVAIGLAAVFVLNMVLLLGFGLVGEAVHEHEDLPTFRDARDVDTPNRPTSDRRPVDQRTPSTPSTDDRAGQTEQQKPGKTSTDSRNPSTDAQPDMRSAPFRMKSPAVLVMAYNRPDLLRQTLTELYKLPEIRRYLVYVSQDGNHGGVSQTAKEFPVTHFQHHPRPSGLDGPAYIARHYKRALDFVFLERKHSHVVILEDDMVVSPDFLQFFESTAYLLDRDPTLWCISSWNDNAFPQFRLDPKRMFRTGYFPGLGWMTTRDVWRDLSPKFAHTHWDHWMRLSATARGRECVVPYVSRNYNIGESGATMDADKFQRYFRNVVYSKERTDDFGNLDYLLSENYEREITTLASQAVITDSPGAFDAAQAQAVARHSPSAATPPVVMGLYLKETFPEWAVRFSIWSFPRTHHRRTLVLPLPQCTLLLADRRHSPYVPEAQRMRPKPGLHPRKSAEGGTCHHACASQAEQCDVSQFDFINNCETLAEHFPCERGFANVQGPDIPNYVNGPQDQYYQQCLVTDDMPTCEASHPGNFRLCPCVAS